MRLHVPRKGYDGGKRMKSNLTSALTQVFLMEAQVFLDHKQAGTGKLRFGLVGENGFLVPFELLLPDELKPSLLEFANKVEAWVATQPIVFSQGGEAGGTAVAIFEEPVKLSLVEEETT